MSSYKMNPELKRKMQQQDQNPLANAWDWLKGKFTSDPGADAETERKQNLYNQADAAGRFADRGQRGYVQMGREAQGSRNYLRQLASGKESVSAEQLRQGLQQNLATQRSMAASASPANAAMAARTAALGMGRAATGMAGQQAIAGLAERQQAQKALSDMIMQQRQQDLQAALQSRTTAASAYGAPNSGQPDKSYIEKYGPAALAAAGMVFSDRRLKTDIEDGDAAANDAVQGLRAFVFRYKNEKNGAGKQTGVMAQDLEKVGLGHAVVDTPEGKMVHGAKLATSNTAMIAALGRRVAKLEGGGK